MRWIAVLSLFAIASSCSDCDNSHREYIITQSHLDEQVATSLMELVD